MYSGVRADVSQAVLRGRVDARRAWGSVALQLDQSPVAANRSMRTARKPSITSKQRLRPFGASFGTPPNASSPSYGGQHPAINTKTAAHSAVQQRNSAASGGYRGVQSAESQSQRQRPRQSAQSPPKPLHPAANVTSVTPSKARANKGTNKSRSSPTNQTQTQSRKKPAGSVAARQPTATSNSKPQQESPPRKRSAIAAALSLAPKHAEVTSPASKPRNTTPTDTASQATSAPQSRSSASAPIIDTQSTLPFPPAQLQESVYARGKYFQNREALQEACEEAGIILPNYEDGQHFRTLCPTCQGGRNSEQSLSVKVETQRGLGSHVLYKCFRSNNCGDSGRLPATPQSQRGLTKRSDAQSHSGLVLETLPGTGSHPHEGNVWSSNPIYETPDWGKLTQPLSDRGYTFFKARGISKEVIQANDVRTAFKDFKVDGEWRKLECLAFPYKRDGDVVAVKYRSLEGKRFTQERRCEKILYGHDDIVARDSEHPAEVRRRERAQQGLSEAAFSLEATGKLIIVEGEMDKMACNEAGLWNVVSVPDGAPSVVKQDVDPSQDRKFSYFYSCQNMLQNPDFSSEVILATDADTAGANLAAELSRRLKRHRCKITAWPSGWQDHLLYMDMDAVSQRLRDFEAGVITDEGSRKDANEVLVKDGAYALRTFIEGSTACPIKGLYALSSFHTKIWDLYDGKNFEKPVETGWPVLNEFYKVVPGELTVVTGVPNTGKSEFVDALVLSLAQNYYWPICFASFEKLTHQHFSTLAEKVWGKPFKRREGYNEKDDGPIMSEREVAAAMRLFESMFSWIRDEDDVIMTIDDVLQRAQDAVYRHGIRGLVIDPYNEMEHNRPRNLSETEYVSQFLSKIKTFAKSNSVHVWLVAHPKQMQAWKGAAPNLYDISGSAHFNNKADVGIVVHRDMLSKKDDRSDAPKTEKGHQLEDDPFACHIYVRKVRNRDAGRIGSVVLKYDRMNGRYYDVDTQPGTDINPIRPLWPTSPKPQPQPTPPKLDEEPVAHMGSDIALLDPMSPQIGGEELREYNDQGGMV